jgi:hypothetical protein
MAEALCKIFAALGGELAAVVGERNCDPAEKM